MTKEAFKLVVFPYGEVEAVEGEKCFKYVIGGILLAQKEIKLPNEAILMGVNKGLTELLSEVNVFEPNFKLGNLESAMSLLSNLSEENGLKKYEQNY